MEINLDKYFDDYINDLKNLIKVESYLSEQDTYPNKAMFTVLNTMKEIAEKLGFITYTDPDGYYGYAEIGEGELFGVLGHLDVVPPGDINEWKTKPFELTVNDNKLFGRGTQDDKGPLLAAMYAFKILLDSGHKQNKKVRFIYGTDEETSWRGIQKYCENNELPVMSFTPDADFPLIFAEKGILQFKLTGESSNIEFKSGKALNVVPAKTKYTLEHKEEFKNNLDKYNFKYNNNLEVLGKSVHSEAANKGVNSIVQTFIAMNDLHESNAIKFVCEQLGEDTTFSKVLGNIEDEVTNSITCNLGKVNFTKEKDELYFDFRIPVTYSKEDILQKLLPVTKQYNLEYEEIVWQKPLIVKKDTELVSNLMKAYQDVTGDLETPPLTTGGGTYARAIENCVAFGGVLPGAELTEHQENEYTTIEDVKTAIKIYYKAFEYLTK